MKYKYADGRSVIHDGYGNCVGTSIETPANALSLPQTKMEFDEEVARLKRAGFEVSTPSDLSRSGGEIEVGGDTVYA